MFANRKIYYLAILVKGHFFCVITFTWVFRFEINLIYKFFDLWFILYFPLCPIFVFKRDYSHIFFCYMRR